MEPEPDADNVIPTTESGAAANVTLPPALAALLATASKGSYLYSVVKFISTSFDLHEVLI